MKNQGSSADLGAWFDKNNDKIYHIYKKESLKYFSDLFEGTQQSAKENIDYFKVFIKTAINKCLKYNNIHTYSLVLEASDYYDISEFGYNGFAKKAKEDSFSSLRFW